MDGRTQKNLLVLNQRENRLGLPEKYKIKISLTVILLCKIRKQFLCELTDQ